MYPNLETEQIRHGYTEEYVAEKLGITGQEYRQRMKSGLFQASEARKLALMYGQAVEDLFEGIAK